MTRNTISEEGAEFARTSPLGFQTFKALIPDDYDGIALTVQCVRLGDHAHVVIDSGRHNSGPSHSVSRGYAGRLVLRWNEWLLLRGLFDSVPWAQLFEVENPTHAQLTYFERGGSEPVVAA